MTQDCTEMHLKGHHVASHTRTKMNKR